MAGHNSHPLPPPPGATQDYFNGQPQQQQQQQQQYYPVQPAHPVQEKPRVRARAFSSRSDRSQRSAGNDDLHETSAEKESKRIHSKADPSVAMNEAEPSAVQATVKSSLAVLRNGSYRDSYGVPIAEPDRSNPTRSRWERPLDTIRSFEAAIDGGYNRKSMYRGATDSDSVANFDRRSSYYGNNGGRFPHDSYYGGRPQSSFKPEGSQLDLRQRDSYYDMQQPGPNNGHPPPMPGNGRQRYSRMASEPQLNMQRQQNPNVYPIPNNHRSYETVTSAATGSSGEPNGYQTDLTSSDNSSVERVKPPPKQQRPSEPMNDYGIGFSQNNNYQPSAFTVAMKNSSGNTNQQGNGYQSTNSYAGPPPVPHKESRGTLARKPTAPAANTNGYQQRPDLGDKRKSWFSRTFSKNNH